MGLHTAATHAKKQLRHLRGKNHTALKQEFMHWLDEPEEDEDLEVAWMNHSDWW